jgi:Histidine kinase-, DNA gyrase B-, and HSP90-like ATPase
MARIQDLPPNAASLAMSMRDLGYSLESAVADIVDNSISANATQVDILCDLSLHDPALSILDNGCGMNLEELTSALRHGSKGPRTARLANDLGRFGLGLKTASFSQGRHLTVATREHESDQVCSAEWDLDYVVAENRWAIAVMESREISLVPHIDRLSKPGTLVVWRKLDRLFEAESGQGRDETVNEKLSLLRDHLSLVFHRFLSGEVGATKLTITVNGHPLTPFDPFCRSNKATQRLPKDVLKVNGQKVEIQAYVLPHHSRLSAKEYEFYRTRSEFISNQGAYVYRNGRLMAWGDWFRLVPKGEATKLGRVQVDFPSALDEAWTIDIKKSRARPPKIVREHLRQILPKITNAAVRVHKGRGQKLFEETRSPIWERYADHGQIRYALNRSHPLISQLMSQMDETGAKNLVALLEAISAALPIDMLYTDYSSDPKAFVVPKSSDEDALGRLRALKLGLFADTHFEPEQFMDIVFSTKLYDDQRELVEKFAKGEIK